MIRMDWKKNFPEKNRIYETKNGILYHADSFEIIKEFKEKSVDIIITDPPYNYNTKNIDYEKQSKVYKEKYSKDFVEKLNNIIDFDFKNFFEKFNFVLKKQHYYIFHNKDMLKDILPIVEKNKFNWDLLVYAKKNPVPLNNNNYLKDREFISFIRENGAYFNSQLKNYDLYRGVYFDKVNNTGLGHPTIKHTWIIENFIKISTKKEDIILDMFIGSGTTAIASEKNGRKWIGIEKEKEYVDLAIKRIKKVSEQKKIQKWF